MFIRKQQNGQVMSEWGPRGAEPALVKVHGSGCVLLGPEPWLGHWGGQGWQMTLPLSGSPSHEHGKTEKKADILQLIQDI